MHRLSFKVIVWNKVEIISIFITQSENEVKSSLFQYKMKFSELFNEHRIKSKLMEKSGFFEKSFNRFLLMRGSYERVNKACEFEKVEVKGVKFYYFFTFSY